MNIDMKQLFIYLKGIFVIIVYFFIIYLNKRIRIAKTFQFFYRNISKRYIFLSDHSLVNID